LLKPLEQDLAWTLAIAVFVTAMLLLGGTSTPAPAMRFMFSAASLVLLAVAAWRLRDQMLTSGARWGLGLVALMLALFFIQLIPLPPVLEVLLPGRDAIDRIQGLAGASGGWKPMSLSPLATRESLTALLPGLAACLAILAVPAPHRYMLALAAVAVAVINVLLALAQKFTGGLHPYALHAAGDASGLFANRNFMAAQLYASLPMLAVLALSGAKTKRIPVWLAAIIALAYFAVVLAGLAVAGSRAGTILCMLAVVGSFFLPWGRLKSHRMATRTRFGFYVAAIAVFLFGQFGLVGLLRFTELDPLGDYRVSILSTSMQALRHFWPLGSGFGTFIPVYQMFETPATMREAFVNHAHNDWLEIVLEGGVPALLLLVAFLLWFLGQAFRIWRRRGDASGDLTMMAASLSASLLLLHSAVDYPLRTPALMTLFGLCLGLMASPVALRQVRLRQAPPLSETPMSRKPLRPFQSPPSGTLEGDAA
jgi:O-antigen ligase